MDIEAPRGARYYGDLLTAPSGGIIANSAFADSDDLILYQYINGAWKAIYSLTLLISYLLKENGDKLLLENGDKLLME